MNEIVEDASLFIALNQS